MASKWIGPDALAGAHGAGIRFRDSDDAKSNPPSPQSQHRSAGALAAAAVADPSFRHKMVRALRSDRLRLEFTAEIAVLFGRKQIEAVLGRFGGNSDQALAGSGGDQVPPRVLHGVAP